MVSGLVAVILNDEMPKSEKRWEGERGGSVGSGTSNSGVGVPNLQMRSSRTGFRRLLNIFLPAFCDVYTCPTPHHLSRMKSRYGQWMCWMLMGGSNGLVRVHHEHIHTAEHAEDRTMG